MGFKEFLVKLKDGAAKTAKTTGRYNSPSFCGNVNRGVKNSDFWEGSYVNVENKRGLIYGSNQEDYTFTAEDIVCFELQEKYKAEIGKGGNYYPAKRYLITFKDGKQAQFDLLDDKIDSFKKIFNLEKEEN